MLARRPTRWHAAGWFWRYAPEFRGRDRVFTLIKGAAIPTRLAAQPQTVCIGDGLRCTVNLADDGSFVALFFAGYRDPALVPILEASLGTGDCFYDVGANIGIYSLWASRLVGSAGEVHAFEPAPHTRGWLEGLVAENAARNIVVEPFALSDREAIVKLALVEHASGISRIEEGGRPTSANESRPDAATSVDVRALRADDYAATHRPPTLVKIDVEGHESAVIGGMHEVLEVHRPVVVFEAPDPLSEAGQTQAIVKDLEGLGFEAHSLTPRGLEPFRPDSYSHNILAVDPGVHGQVIAKLERTRFPRQQNC